MVAAEIAPSPVDLPAVGAGFWLRAAAWLIDYPFLAALAFGAGYLAGTLYPPIIPHYYALALMGLLLWGSYFAFFESSPLRGTPESSLAVWSSSPTEALRGFRSPAQQAGSWRSAFHSLSQFPF